jgi:hypothetical protein
VLVGGPAPVVLLEKVEVVEGASVEEPVVEGAVVEELVVEVAKL